MKIKWIPILGLLFCCIPFSSQEVSAESCANITCPSGYVCYYGICVRPAGTGTSQSDCCTNGTVNGVSYPPPNCDLSRYERGACYGAHSFPCQNDDSKCATGFRCSLRYDGVYVCVGIPTAVNGECGTTINTCTKGTFADVTDTETHYMWNCNGSGGGTNVMCSSIKPTCTGTLPFNATACNTNLPTVSTPWQQGCSGTTTCRFQCNAGSIWNAGTQSCGLAPIESNITIKWTLDNTPPTGGALNIKDDPNNIMEYDGIKYTKQNAITLKVTCATDIPSPPVVYAISEGSNISSEYQTCSDEKEHILSSGDGEKIMNVRFKDSLGNTTDPNSNPQHTTSIVLDTKKPIVTITNVAGDTVVPYIDEQGDNKTIVELNVVEENLLECRYSATYVGSNDFDEMNQCTGRTCTIPGLEAKVYPDFSFMCKDKAGNIGEKTIEIIVDYTAPTVGAGLIASGEYYSRLYLDQSVTDEPLFEEENNNDNLSKITMYVWGGEDNYNQPLSGQKKYMEEDFGKECSDTIKTGCYNIIYTPGTAKGIYIQSTNRYTFVAEDVAGRKTVAERQYKITYLTPVITDVVKSGDTLTIKGMNFGAKGSVLFSANKEEETSSCKIYSEEDAQTDTDKNNGNCVNKTLFTEGAIQEYIGNNTVVIKFTSAEEMNTFIEANPYVMIQSSEGSPSGWYAIPLNIQGERVLRLTPSSATVVPGGKVQFSLYDSLVDSSITYTFSGCDTLRSSQDQTGANKNYMFTAKSADDLADVSDLFCTLTATASGSESKATTATVYVVGGTSKGMALQYGMIYDLPGVAIFLDDLVSLVGQERDIYFNTEKEVGAMKIEVEHDMSIGDAPTITLKNENDVTLLSYSPQGGTLISSSNLITATAKKVKISVAGNVEGISRIKVYLYPSNAGDYSMTIPESLITQQNGAGETTSHIEYITTGYCYQIGTVVKTADNKSKAIVSGDCPTSHLFTAEKHTFTGNPGPIGVPDGYTPNTRENCDNYLGKYLKYTGCDTDFPTP